MNNYINYKFQIEANYQAKSKSLDFEISLPPMLLKILYGVRGDAFPLFVRIWVEYSKNMTIIDTKIWFSWFWHT